MTLRIDRMTLRLPAHLAPHAEGIARAVADGLVAIDVGRPARLARIDVGPVAVRRDAAPADVAAAVARAITRRVAEARA